MGMTRRRFLKQLSSMAAVAMPGLAPLWAQAKTVPTLRPIPSTGEAIPAVGMGTWITFDEGDGARKRQLSTVLREFFARGGKLIDTSPMYGLAEEVLGELLPGVDGYENLFAATKVWINGKSAGVRQMQRSERRVGVKHFDLIQVHNLRDWQVHLDTLRQWKDEDLVRYIGVTTSHGRRHEELEEILRTQELDFVQFTYNLRAREAERRLLPIARERGIAVIINRPFGGGELFGPVRGEKLPAWAADIDCDTWSQFFLKFIISQPGVTCAIPATSQPAHMRENMGALYGRLPSPSERKRMLNYFNSL